LRAEDPARHSRARDAEPITNPDLPAEREAFNGLRQFDSVVEIVKRQTNLRERESRLKAALG